MNDPASRHPQAETMAAFLEGKLAPGDLAAVSAHLRDCEACRTVLGETARFEREEAAAPQRRRWPYLAAAAAAILAILTLVPLLRPKDPIDALIAASPRDYRRVEGRLSEFPWARWQGAPRAAATASAERELAGAAHAVIGRIGDEETVEARHDAGVAHLLIGELRPSLEKLASAASESKDAAVWNDLAAARLTVAVREGDAALLPPALAAADRALALDAGNLDAHFNRALILEELGLRNEARKAWQRYLERDSSSGWASEARAHLNALGEPEADLDFTKELARAADRAAIASLVRRFPQESRSYGECLLLGEWADAVLANDAARAEERRARIEAIAAELAKKNEWLLFDAVQAIARAPAPRVLATAHARYRDARAAYGERRLAEACAGLRSAEGLFRDAGSPMSLAAATFAAKCTFDATGDAAEALRMLRARVDASRHRALAADLDWALALQAVTGADWGTAARHTGAASETYVDLDERLNAAWMDAMGAIALERIGAGSLAWQRRIAAMSVYTAPRQQHRLATILHSAALSLAAGDDVPSATAIMDVAIDIGGSLELQARMHTDRARLAEREGDLAAARAHLASAHTEAARIEDAGIRGARDALIALADGVLQRASDPLRAVATLDRSVEYFTDHRQDIFLADAFLERARAHRAMRRLDDAAGDYRAALAAIDRQRANANVSVEFLDVAARAIDESIDLHLQRGQAAEAFAVADRAKALPAKEYRRAELPPGVALLEYALLPDALAVFCVTRDGIVAERVPIARATLGARVRAFSLALRAHKDVRAEAKALHEMLIAPVAPHLAGAHELVIVRDRDLNMLPFAALHDGTSHLVERYALRMATSAASSTPLDAGSAAATATVVISDPATPRAGRLPGSRTEAADIAAVYRAEVLEGSAATRTRVTEAIANSAIIHYAGHADSDAGSYGALLLAGDGVDSGLLTAGDIARMTLRGRPLVVLSACGTLRGSTSHVAGMPSLARAFLDAGARAVAGTLWEVEDDVTGPLFLRFHQSLREDRDPAKALRTAQLAMLQSPDPRWSHPASWAAVEVLANL
jgi:CHAT domain-containing protein